MIQQLLNMTWALVIAKLMLNDVPHLLDNFTASWVDNAWVNLLQYMKSTEHKKELVFAKPLGEAFKRAEDLITGKLPEVYNPYDPMTPRDLRDLKTVLAGYYLIAEGQASDKVVEDVFRILKERLDIVNKEFSDEEWAGVDLVTYANMPPSEQEEVNAEEWWYDVARAYEIMVSAKTRTDKVVGIDAMMHAAHTHGPALSYLFVGLYETELEWAVRDMLDRLGA